MKRDLILRTASLKPDTFDPETNTVEVVLSTGAAVKRAGYVEKLDINGADLRGIAGSSVLDAHNQGSTRAVLGAIVKAWRAGGEIRALLKLSSRDDVAGIVRDIADGIIRNVSIGYSVSKWRDETNSKGERVRTALAWKIFEASFVPIGADPGAQTRSNPMKTKKKGSAPAPELDEVEDVQDTTPTVAETRAAIRDTFRRALPNDLTRAAEEADAIIDDDGTIEEAQSRAYEIMQERTARTPRTRVITQHDSPQAIMERRVGGIYSRVTGAQPKPEEREFANMRIVDHARAMLVERGVSVVGLSDFDAIHRAHTTSDFPEALTGVGNRVLMEQFEAARSPLIGLGRPATAADFRRLDRLRVSELDALQPLGGENSELQNISRSEVIDSYSIESFGGIFSLSFKAQVNDDMSAFTDFSRVAAQAVAQYQKAKIVDLIEGNPVSDDGNALFSSAHGNLMVSNRIISAAGSLAALSDARVAMRTQTGLDGVTTLNLKPKFLVVPAELETEAQQALSLVYAANASDANAFTGTLELMVEAALTGQGWYVFADPAAAPVFEHAWLAGAQGPQMASQENFRTLARDFRVVAHWGAGLLPGGWRGAVFTPEDSNS